MIYHCILISAISLSLILGLRQQKIGFWQIFSPHSSFLPYEVLCTYKGFLQNRNADVHTERSDFPDMFRIMITQTRKIDNRIPPQPVIASRIPSLTRMMRSTDSSIRFSVSVPSATASRIPRYAA